MRFIILFLLVPFFGWTQLPDSLDTPVVEKKKLLNVKSDSASLMVIDSILTKKEKPRKKIIKTFFEDYPNPKKALFAGLILPGGGQMYNGAFWKVPLVYGAYGTVITIIVDNTRQYNYLREQHRIWVQIGDEDVDDFIRDSFTSASQVQTVRDEFQRQKEYAWFALFGVTLLSVADAFVDCHLKGFDVDDDISFEIKPSLIQTPGWGNSAALGFSIPLR